jgi:membrane-bound serine protease (ClpP class)
MYAAHIAAMAPGTSLGAATPVQMGMPGTTPSDGRPDAPGPAREPDAKHDGAQPAQAPGTAMERKVLNDAIAFLRTLAQMRGRNADWAERAVRDAATLTANEAVAQNVADLLAENRADLLAKLDGREVRTASGVVKLATRDAQLLVVEPDLRTRALGAIADPNIAFILLLIGIYGLLFELWHPGFGLPGTVGALCLLLAMVSLSVLPIHYGGLALLLLGIALMAGEALTPGVGVLGVGGLAAFVIGAVFLFDPAGADIAIGVAKPLIAAAAVTSAALFIFVLGYVLRARRRVVRTGAEEMLGARAQVRQWSGQAGVVHVHGEMWSARGNRAYVPGEYVEIAARDGLVLFVRPIAASAESIPEGAQHHV